MRILRVGSRLQVFAPQRARAQASTGRLLSPPKPYPPPIGPLDGGHGALVQRRPGGLIPGQRCARSRLFVNRPTAASTSFAPGRMTEFFARQTGRDALDQHVHAVAAVNDHAAGAVVAGVQPVRPAKHVPRPEGRISMSETRAGPSFRDRPRRTGRPAEPSAANFTRRRRSCPRAFQLIAGARLPMLCGQWLKA